MTAPDADRVLLSPDAEAYRAGMARDPDPNASAPPRTRLAVGAVIAIVLLALAATVAIALLRGLGAPGETLQLERDAGGAAAGGAAGDGGIAGDDDTAGDDDVAGPPVGGQGELYVHVFGAVRAAGLYLLSGGARVVDGVAAAGGFRDDADPGAVNLARPLSDGEQLYVPTVQEARAAREAAGPGSAGGGAGALAPDGRLNLNTASVEQLDALPRIGPAMAQRIVQWRASNGRFTSVDDLLAVPGIGEETLESLRALVCI
ncbi:MAG TPA: ComEA family DNA-binding protein [Microbacteriaceae bacterium]|nr:ComEA family DNA-binding protein [Microbacteriaceae bacterium]